MQPAADLSVTGSAAPLPGRSRRWRWRPRVGRIEPTSARSTLLLAAPVLAVSGLAAVACFIGADARWLAALGSSITDHAAIPNGVPFATAPTSPWPNAIALAELVFHALERGLGDWGLMIAQVLAVMVAIAVLARDAVRGGATAGGAAAALIIAAVGALPSLAVARVQLFSLALFPILVALLRREVETPSRRIWLAVPLLALWSNLHGAAIIGLLVTLGYLVLHRLRTDPRTAVVVAFAAVLAMLLTPAGIRTITYYQGILMNQAAARGSGLWGPLSPSAPLDVLLIAAAAALAWRLPRAPAARWELAVVLGLVAMTIHASRSGVWLLLFLAPTAARTFHPRPLWNRLLPALVVCGLAASVVAVVRGPLASGASSSLVARAITLARGTPILADDVAAEQVALAGGRIWVGDPIDAFSRRDQAVYLDWSEGKPNGRRALGPAIGVILTSRGSAAERLMHLQPGFRSVASDRTADVFLRSG